MKKTILIIQVFICVICLSNCSITEKKAINEEVYGQTPPGNIPEIFEPRFDFIKNGIPDEFDFSPDFKEFIYTVNDTSVNKQIIYYTRKNKGSWMNSEIAYFVPDSGIGYNPKFSPDGKYISYSCNGDLWRAKKDGENWTIAEKIKEPVSTDKYECTVSISKSGNIYFAGNGRPDGKSNQCDIYCTRFNGIKLDSARNLGNLNTPRSECSVSVSPNENYIVFTRYFNKQGRNATDLYISFRKNDNDWTIAQDLGPFFNCTGTNFSPKISNDGNYFFFKQGIWSDRLEKYEIKQYWVSTNLLDNMRDFVFSSNNLAE